MANKAWGKDSEEYQKWMKGSEEYTKFLPEDAAYFTGINPNTGESADEYGNELLGINEENTQLNQNVKIKNYLIVLDADGKAQFDDTKNSIWEVKLITNLASYTIIQNIIKSYSFRNFCLVHHGNTYSTVSIPKDERMIFGVERMEQMEKIINAVGNKDFLEMDDSYFESLQKKSNELYIGGYPTNELKAFCSLKALIANIKEGGCYFSIACDEADDINLSVKLSAFATNNIKIFTNSNYTTIRRKNSYVGITGYGSILNSFLTDSVYWIDNSGWKIYNSNDGTTVITNKDLWLYSKNKKKVYDLITRKKELNDKQKEKQSWAQTYYSKTFERQYVKKWGQEAYKKYLLQIEAKYPEFKQ